MLFRKKPFVVEAVQLRWDNWSEMCGFAGVGRLSDGQPEGCYIASDGQPLPEGQTSEEIGMVIPKSVGGVLVVRQNDWVIRSPDGQLCRLKPDVFEAIYDEIAPVPSGCTPESFSVQRPKVEA